MVSTTAAVETQFAEQFREFIKGESNAELRKLREDAFAAFTASGFPTPKDEDWKYTSVAKVVSGQWSVGSGQSSDLNDDEIALLGRFNSGRNGFAALNLAFGEFQVVRIAKETSLK